jgi:hypothetical protein
MVLNFFLLDDFRNELKSMYEVLIKIEYIIVYFYRNIYVSRSESRQSSKRGFYADSKRVLASEIPVMNIKILIYS